MSARVRISPELISATVGVVLFSIHQFSKWVNADFPMTLGVAGTSGVVFGAIIVGAFCAGIVWAARKIPRLLILLKSD